MVDRLAPPTVEDPLADTVEDSLAQRVETVLVRVAPEPELPRVGDSRAPGAGH